jgi:hypothetical protein
MDGIRLHLVEEVRVLKVKIQGLTIRQVGLMAVMEFSVICRELIRSVL